MCQLLLAAKSMTKATILNRAAVRSMAASRHLQQEGEAAVAVRDVCVPLDQLPDHQTQ